ncbi:SDR family NAD(P)-dependent oxidoreductase [Pelorhabdus rhamnosifermentans]|uniref:SDR family NAD(P)-dependent oxidoreductase n=1 Tax=Pelorhabdus rhamnosifermentans TaxID=2772457 RepID=UPI001C062D20|nr:SDR family oxidoreductase [Pelorhabdus rhamnosifermentans]
MASSVTLITGTSRGIGKYLAEYYVSLGHQVIGCSRHRPEWSLENYEHFEVAVNDEIGVKKMFSAIRKKYGKLDHLINNAGIASMNHFMLTPVDTVRNVLETNLIGTFLVTREASKLMQKQKQGRIVNFSTVAVPLKLEGEAIYASSKAGVVTMTQILAKELAELGITVNAVGPTPIKTDLIRSVPKDKIERLVAQQAIKRFGEFQDVVNVIDFFLRPESNFVTGQIIYLGGI